MSGSNRAVIYLNIVDLTFTHEPLGGKLSDVCVHSAAKCWQRPAEHDCESLRQPRRKQRFEYSACPLLCVFRTRILCAIVQSADQLNEPSVANCICVLTQLSDQLQGSAGITNTGSEQGLLIESGLDHMRIYESRFLSLDGGCVVGQKVTTM